MCEKSAEVHVWARVGYDFKHFFFIFPEFPLSSSDICHDDHVRHQSRWSVGRCSGHSSGWRLHPAPDCCPAHSVTCPASSDTGPAHCAHQDGRHDRRLPAGGAAGPRGETFSTGSVFYLQWWDLVRSCCGLVHADVLLGQIRTHFARRLTASKGLLGVKTHGIVSQSHRAIFCRCATWPWRF